MKINIIKEHVHYEQGIQDVEEERAQYLIKMGIAEEVEEKSFTPAMENKLSPVKPANKQVKKKNNV